MIIKYFNKEIKELKTDLIDAKLIEYEISENDMYDLAQLQDPLKYQINRIFLTQNNKKFDLVVDNIANGRIVQGGLKDQKYILNQYIVKKGLNDLLKLLALAEIPPTPTNNF